MALEPAAYSAAELHTGLTAEFERELTEEDVLSFAAVSGDENPLHVDAVYARGTNFGARLVHGAFQVGLASALIGMHLPGRRVLLVSTHAQYLKPLYFPARVRVRGEVVAWDAASMRGNLRVTIAETASGITASEIYMGFTYHETPSAGDETEAAASASAEVARGPARDDNDRRVVLVTGAAGGIGSAIVARLAEQYAVLAVVNRSPLPAELVGPYVTQIRADFADPGWERQIENQIGERPLYGVVHAAWPGLAQGGLLKTAPEVLAQQIAFGTTHAIGLARLLSNRADAAGGRYAALGSTAGTQKPVLGMAAYSLGKAALENTIRLLAPELAIRRITINAICPGFVPAGMNRQANERQRKMVAAQIPMGRLCETGDILGTLCYLFSEEASFVSGQTIILSGGQL